MKNKLIISWFFLITLLGSTTVIADDSSLEQKEGAENTYSYGIINAIYPEESRVVIDDMSIQYDNQSAFKNLFGRTLSGTEKILKAGSMVRYRIGSQGKTQFIQELEVISKRKYQYETTKQRADDH